MKSEYGDVRKTSLPLPIVSGHVICADAGLAETTKASFTSRIAQTELN